VVALYVFISSAVFFLFLFFPICKGLGFLGSGAQVRQLSWSQGARHMGSLSCEVVDHGAGLEVEKIVPEA